MNANALQIDVSYLGGLAVVTVDGEIDIDTASKLRVALDQVDPQKHTYVDMANVRFMDSSGIKVLIAQAFRMSENHGQLHIQNPSKAVRRVITIVGLGDLFFETSSVSAFGMCSSTGPCDATEGQAVAHAPGD